MRAISMVLLACCATACGGLFGPTTDANGCDQGNFACVSPEVESGTCCANRTASGSYTDTSGSVGYLCAWGQDVRSIGCFKTLEEAHEACDCKPNPTPGYPPTCVRDQGNPTGYVMCTK